MRFGSTKRTPTTWFCSVVQVLRLYLVGQTQVYKKTRQYIFILLYIWLALTFWLTIWPFISVLNCRTVRYPSLFTIQRAGDVVELKLTGFGLGRSVQAVADDKVRLLCKDVLHWRQVALVVVLILYLGDFYIVFNTMLTSARSSSHLHCIRSMLTCELVLDPLPTAHLLLPSLFEFH